MEAYEKVRWQKSCNIGSCLTSRNFYREYVALVFTVEKFEQIFHICVEGLCFYEKNYRFIETQNFFFHESKWGTYNFEEPAGEE